MDPAAIAREFNKGSVSMDSAKILFVGCAGEWEIADIVCHVPETMKESFRTFILDLPQEDMPILGLDRFVLKKEWIERFKQYYLEPV